jgi:hypothetical protein
VVKNPDALAQPTTAMVHPIRGTECEIVLCCSFTGRHDILQQIIHESTTCNATVRWMLCGSTPEDTSFIEMIARQTGVVAGFNCENRPLGRKWQTCVVEATKLFKAETFGIIGSDDFASRRLLDHIAGLIRKEREAEIYTDLYCTLEWLLWIRNDESPLSPNILRRTNLRQQARPTPRRPRIRGDSQSRREHHLLLNRGCPTVEREGQLGPDERHPGLPQGIHLGHP